jgi:predicted  nucleic acid-binding Zn-ribbon protein
VEVFWIKNYTNVDLEDKLEALTKKVDNLQNEVKTLWTKLDKNSQKLENITLKLVSESEKKLEQSGTHVEFQTWIILSWNVVTWSVVTGN